MSTVEIPTLTGTPLQRAEALSDFLLARDAEGETLGRLPDDVAKAITETGVIKMLQPKTHGGTEDHPVDFLKTVVALGSRSASAGWVAGVVGVHPHELAIAHPKVQEEIWGEDQDTWVASPYAPLGVAKPVDGGYLLTGRWTFSSGTDHCQWVMIGGFVADADGNPNRTDIRHFILPRGDYEIVEGSWEVMGLRGTGSKDLIVTEMFVPDYRVIDASESGWRAAIKEYDVKNPLFAIPRTIMFSGTINGGTLAMAKGVLDAYKEWMLRRKSNAVTGSSHFADPHRLRLFGEVSADIDVSIRNYLSDFERVFDIVSTQPDVPLEVRAEIRRNQVRDVTRATEAADRLFVHGGGAALHMHEPLQRMWRDMHAGRNHGSNVAEPTLQNYAGITFGLPPLAGARL